MLTSHQLPDHRYDRHFLRYLLMFPSFAWGYCRSISGCLLRLAGAVLVLAAICPPSFAKASTAGLCDAVAYQASRESGVPVSVLLSITRTETGRNRNGQLEPWPWTVNMEGRGRWFDTEDDARSYVFSHFKRGARSFDVGCFQINYKWHGQAFRSIDQMFDPLENARYAARFLGQLYRETGDWAKAAGSYHSRTPEYAARYRARFEKIRANLAVRSEAAKPVSDPNLPPRAIPENRVERRGRPNSYPLLTSGPASGSLGSLVPVSSPRATPLLGIANEEIQ